MSQKLSQSAAQTTRPDKSYAHGIQQLPSDDINELMHNNFNKEYIVVKSQRDDYFNTLKL